eukprot:CAMPEP_0202880862 /NCGR_PEP_ID=MMETSP1391-20130828/35658_1 /ASSEMBLY_ACC=CAM_ASM_000867 /TAXON_ID=1034604 /ORGANISM="Chlamydomonas leiostraca, Strain SAG 11-49" /LENGTH=74 /DNA_ID=CAMNT_0049563433 /DNA_START=281 /DNA_END=502 /DNA_ORIENTATION=-
MTSEQLKACARCDADKPPMHALRSCPAISPCVHATLQQSPVQVLPYDTMHAVVQPAEATLQYPADYSTWSCSVY